MAARRASNPARRSVPHRWGCRLVALACAWTLAACAGDGPPPTPASSSPDATPSPAASSFDALQQTIFTPNCLFAGCHNATDQAGNQVLVEGQAYKNLVNAIPSNDAARAAGFRRVVPNNPDRSFLLIKLIGGPNFDPRYGSPMPLTGSPLSAADIERIRSWIVAGAPPPNAAAAAAAESAPRTPTTTAAELALPTPTATASPTPTATPEEVPLPTETPIAPTGESEQEIA